MLDTLSASAARALGRALAAEGVDVDVEGSRCRVWCFADHEFQVRALECDLISDTESSLACPPTIRVWSSEHSHYVDPGARHEDPDSHQVFGAEFDPSEIGWRVRLELASVWEFRRVRKELLALGRPEIRTGMRSIDLAARDLTDAERLIRRARTIDGVADGHASEMGRFERWRIRERLAGSYAVDPHGSGGNY